MEKFSTVLSSATKHKPLVILFVSLDQLSPDGGARQLSWLPKSLPDHVKFIVSTLPDNEFRCFPKLKVFFIFLPAWLPVGISIFHVCLTSCVFLSLFFSNQCNFTQMEPTSGILTIPYSIKTIHISGGFRILKSGVPKQPPRRKS